MKKTKTPAAEILTFVEYLETTLIPDLRESGSDFTADDFDTAVRTIKDLLWCASLSRAFVGMHTGAGVPKDLSGVFDSWLDSPARVAAAIDMMIARPRRNQ